MVFWQLTIDAHDPVRLADFWAHALGYAPAPPPADDTPAGRHYRRRLGDRPAFDDRIFDPAGVRPPLWFQQVPEDKAGKNRLHLDLYPTGRDDTLSQPDRVAAVDAYVQSLLARGARRTGEQRSDDPDDSYYYVAMTDPEGNEFDVSG